MNQRKTFYSLVVYVPEESLERVKQALFEAGAGRIGNYDSCCWQTMGTGQFRPGSGSNPAVGKEGLIERVPEARIELCCAEENLERAISAIRRTHPYEEPAFHYWRVEG